ncbi:hypothetical protein QIG87_26760, partial [Klebsiella pneumoniae]|nr:hypothetical protein [Klebsiella pneumoniae]
TFAFPGHTRFGFALYITEPQRSIESSPISLVFPSDIVLTAINPKKPLEQSKALALIKKYATKSAEPRLPHAIVFTKYSR